MADDDTEPSERLYRGIASLPGWDRALGHAQVVRDSYSARVGSVLSAVFLAGGADREAIAVTGKLTEDDRGFLAVVYETSIVHVHVEALTAQDSDVRVSVYSVQDVDRLDVRTRHNYFDGSNARRDGIEFDIDIRGHVATFKPGHTGLSSLSGPDAVHAAFELLRDARSLSH